MSKQTPEVEGWMVKAARTMYKDQDFPAAEAALMRIHIAEAYEPQAKRGQALVDALDALLAYNCEQETLSPNTGKAENENIDP